MSDRGYINLFRHLTRTSSTLPLDTLQASIAHYLARPPLPAPGTPTPLVAAVLGSALFKRHSHTGLAALALAFRHAVHLRVGLLKQEAEDPSGGLSFLSRGVDVRAKLARWTKEVREGFAGSDALARLACASGLLLGLEDWEEELKIKEKERRVRARVEEEVVLALAEVVEEHAREGSGWEEDFRRTVGTQREEDSLALAVLLASQCTQCIAAERLRALPLSTVADVLMTTINCSFYGGAFLYSASNSASTDAEGRLIVSPTTAFAQSIGSVGSSPCMTSMASLARFTARALAVLVESRRASGWETLTRLLTHFQSLTSAVEKDWQKCPLARVSKDEDFSDSTTREIATATWSILKTLLFTTLMISQSVLSAVVFVSNPHEQPSSPSSPYALALTVLHILASLSFVMPQFGGVASTSEGGLPELKRAFYMALDVLSASDVVAERFVAQLFQGSGVSMKGKGVDTLPRSLLDAKKAFALACIEQLIPVLSEETIRTQVYPLCVPHLSDPGHRETFESAHSVMLAIFAAHARASAMPKDTLKPAPSFVEKLVPMYAYCLIENSTDDRLSSTQLSMAYAALVRSANSFGHRSRANGTESAEGDSMAWFCVEVLLDAIHAAHVPPTGTPSEQVHRLHLALVASVPSVSLVLLPRLLDAARSIVVSLSTADPRAMEMRDELVQGLFKAVLQDVGDAEKEYGIGWWLENRATLSSETKLPSKPASPENSGELVARL
ncbi:hypothetical protein C8Q78DRAFT_974125 [Trametes maxima]|nr:hypothetical protein C8Q78DRAFT_974125 [Trametes maxima]